MSPDVVVLMPGEPSARDPWIGGAAAAADALRAEGADVRTHIGIPEELPAARVIVCHGVQYAALVRREPTMPVIISDLLDDTPAGPVTTVDWCWPDLAAEAGRYAAAFAGGAVGFVAGPAVPTQRRVVASFAEAAGPGITAIHLPAFDAVELGRRAGAFLVEEAGCAIVAHSADSAGVAAGVAARRGGGRTIGFLAPARDDIAWIESDIPGALSTLARRALDGEALPARFAADAASGFGRFAVRN